MLPAAEPGGVQARPAASAGNVALAPALLVLASLLLPPAPGGQTQLGAEFSLQGERIAAACRPKLSSVMSCPVEFLTDHPIHLAVGSLAPQNGFAAGPAFVTHRVSEAYDMSINADAVRAPGGSWRAGVYFKAVLTPVAETVVVPIGASAADTPADLTIHPYPVIDAYAQTTSLRTVYFYGLGPESSKAGRSAFGMRETVAGGRVTYPVFRAGVVGRLGLAVTGEVDGRFVDLSDPDAAKATPVSVLYSDATAPGLASQPRFVQFGEGVRMQPSALGNRLRFDYGVSLAQFVAGSDAHSTFHRWTADLDQEFSFYRTVAAADSSTTHGPDDCSSTLGRSPCPPPSLSRNRYGSVAFHVHSSTSTAAADASVPFYFQPTLGGSDIDGVRRLTAYDDYRFRGPRVFLMRESLEHYVYGVVGISLVAEQGTVSAPGAALRLGALKHSTAAGVSLRAGGLPVATVSWAWGSEGHRLVATVSTSLLGGGGRPSLF